MSRKKTVFHTSSCVTFCFFASLAPGTPLRSRSRLPSAGGPCQPLLLRRTGHCMVGGLGSINQRNSHIFAPSRLHSHIKWQNELLPHAIAHYVKHICMPTTTRIYLKQNEIEQLCLLPFKTQRLLCMRRCWKGQKLGLMLGWGAATLSPQCT